MSNQELGIRLEFAQFGHFDSFSVCRSLSPMDPLNPPPPIVSGLQTMYYFDTDVLSVLDRNIYYRVIVHRGDEALVSDEIVAYISTFEAPINILGIWNEITEKLDINWDFNE